MKRIEEEEIKAKQAEAERIAELEEAEVKFRKLQEEKNAMRRTRRISLVFPMMFVIRRIVFFGASMFLAHLPVF